MITTGRRKPITAAVAMLLASAAIAGCGAQTTEPKGTGHEIGHIGQIGAELVLGSVIINRVDWTLSNATPPAGFMSPRTGFFDVTGPGSTFTGLITGVPAGNGYDLTFTATSTDGTRLCAGHAAPTPFAVLAGQTVLQAVHLSCQSQATATGSILVNGDVNVCPNADNVTAMPLSTTVGSSIMLTGMGSDPDSAPMPLAYSFAPSAMQPSGAGAGTLTNANTATPSFRCDSPGPVSLTMTVSDSDSACTPSSLQVLVVCTGADLCAGLPPCMASDACHNAGTCDHTTGMCSAGTAKAAGSSCSDGNACNGAETCNAAGTCVSGTPLMCTAQDECHTAGTCDPAAGMCSNPAVANGTACTGGTCQGGVCANPCAPGGVPVVCPAAACQVAGTCNPATGMCSAATPAPNGTACNDGVATNFFDQCTNGVCAGNPSNCNPSNACCACESMAHGTSHNCDGASTLCDTLVGTTTANTGNPGAGIPAIPAVPYAQACRDLLNCFHMTGCAGANGLSSVDCFCGVGNDCLNGGTVGSATGACKALAMEGADSNDLTTISNHFGDNTFPLGVVVQMSETCDRTSCASQCLGGNKFP